MEVRDLADHVREFDLPPFLKAKPSDPTRRAFIEKHGDDSVYELDALTPAQLANLSGGGDPPRDLSCCLRERVG